jgi:aspartyl-tRNA(Asn)/glutamyl-tRNA(Gln) amidotransferase subunit C
MDVAIDKKLIERVAENARLYLSEEEKEKFVKELKEILNAFSQIDEVDTKGIPISLQPVELKNHMREDEPKPCLTQEDALSLSEHKKDGYFKGPKVV